MGGQTIRDGTQILEFGVVMPSSSTRIYLFISMCLSYYLTWPPLLYHPLSIIYLYVVHSSWLCAYMVQMNPLIGPRLTNETLIWMARTWVRLLTFLLTLTFLVSLSLYYNMLHKLILFVSDDCTLSMNMLSSVEIVHIMSFLRENSQWYSDNSVCIRHIYTRR